MRAALIVSAVSVHARRMRTLERETEQDARNALTK
jgi:hypothetical protein